MVECYLCKSSKEDDIQYGEMLQNKKMAVHTFCLYLSSNLSQNGDDDEGFLGFLEADIKKEARRVSLLKCIYCRKWYANVGCCKSKCRHTFHFICGLENGAENQFCGSFKSFCKRHGHKSNYGPTENDVCVICCDNLRPAGERFNSRSMIRAPCCRNGWFHKLCLQRFAKTAGYFFKCPLCNDARIFRQQLPVKGIFIPNQDAAWELEPNAFSELLERPNECAATECQCKEGRTHSSSSNPFIFCSTCGSIALHSHCVPNRASRFHCADCTVAQEQDSGRESLISHAYNNGNDEEIDVCNVSDKEDLEIIRGLLPAPEPQRRGEEDHETRAESACSSEEEEIKLARSRRVRLLSSNSDSSEKSKENRPPSRRSESLSPCNDKPQVSVTQRPIQKVRVIRDSILSVEDLTRSTTSELPNDEVKNLKELSSKICSSREETEKNEKYKQSVGEKIILAITVEESSEDEWHSGGVQRSHISASSDEVILNKTAAKRIVQLQSDDEEIPKKQRKLHSKTDQISDNMTKQNMKVFANDEDSEGDNEPLAKYANAKTNRHTERDSAVAGLTSSEESDDDPVECFTKMVKKQNNLSCIAQRTRTKSVYVENQQQLLSFSSADMQKCAFQIEDQTKSIKFHEKKKENLDISCIARRTRRKSMHCPTKESKSLTPSQVRNRTESSRTRGRRKTVCSETPVEKNKQQKTQQVAREAKVIACEDSSDTTPDRSPVFQMSQICEIDCDTDEDTGPQNKMLNISCIANRTRKRKSVKMLNIIEDDDLTTSSCSSTTSYKTALTDFRSNYAWRRRQRISSSSSEGTENNYKVPLTTRKLNNEKWPKQNYNMAFNETKLHLVNSSSYHPNNLHHPHTNNRKRV